MNPRKAFEQALTKQANQALSIVLKKWQEAMKGGRIVINDSELDLLSDYLKAQDTSEADLYFKRFVTIPNPRRIGVRDQYIGWVK
jgi:hypothetical protein